MPCPQHEILQEIDQFEPGPARDWRELDELLGELWQTEVSEACLPVLFRVFERFPDDPGCGVCWGIVHGVEATTLDYEEALHKSIARHPSELGHIMLRRLEKWKASVQ